MNRNEPIVHRVLMWYARVGLPGEGYRRPCGAFFIMLRSCKWCGRIHDDRYDCGKKPRRKPKDDTEAAKFRRSSAWKRMSIAIRERDHWLCAVCLTGKYLAPKALTWEGLSVHHIVPVAEAPERALDETNLITLCQFHHELAESGYIPREELAAIVAAVPPGA